MDGGKSHRGVEGLVLEREALRGGSHARRCACGTLRTHDRRRLHRGDVTVGGFIGAGASPDIEYRPRIAERSPDLRGDPRLGAPRHGVGGSDGVVQLRAGHDTRSCVGVLALSTTLPGGRTAGSAYRVGRVVSVRLRKVPRSVCSQSCGPVRGETANQTARGLSARGGALGVVLALTCVCPAGGPGTSSVFAESFLVWISGSKLRESSQKEAIVVLLWVLVALLLLFAIVRRSRDHKVLVLRLDRGRPVGADRLLCTTNSLTIYIA